MSIRRMSARAKRATLKPKQYDADVHRLHLQVNRATAHLLEARSDTDIFHAAILGKRYESSKEESTFPPPFDKPSSSDDVCSSSCNQTHSDPSISSNTDHVDVISTVHVVSDDQTGERKSKRRGTVVICSYDYLEHYQIDADKDIHIRIINVFPIQKTVIGVSDNKTFTHLQREKFCTELLLEACEHSVLLRTNDDFLASCPKTLKDEEKGKDKTSDLRVMECCPVRDGVLMVNTQIILSRLADDELRKKDFYFKLPIRSISGGKEDLCLVSDFCQSMKTPQSPLSLSTSSRSSQLSLSSEITVAFECIEQQVLWQKLLCRPQNDIQFDPMYVIGMPKETMLKHGLFEESLVKVSLDIQMPVLASRLAIIKCLCANVAPREDKVYISPLLKFNLQLANSAMSMIVLDWLRIERIKEAVAETDVDRGTVSTSLHAQLPVAKEVHISVVTSPNYSPRSIHTEAVKAYFSVPRLLTKGDVIPVQSKDDPQYCAIGDQRQTIVYFKVTKVSGPKSVFPSCICDQTQTRLVQVGSLHTYVPLLMEAYLTKGCLNYWSHAYLPGMNQYVEKLESLIRPHLHNRLDYSSLKDVLPSVMLIGQSGCGKTTTTFAVARRLNLQVYKVNCHQLYGESTGATESRISNVINAAITYSPCILLLHSIHALGKDKERYTDDPRVASAFRLSVQNLMEQCGEYPVIVVGTTHSISSLAADIHGAFLHSVNLEVPNENDRADILDGLLQNVTYSGDLCGQYLAQRTAGYVLGDLVALVSHAMRNAYKAIMNDGAGKGRSLSNYEEEDLSSAGIVVQHGNFVAAFDQLQAAHSDTIGAPKIPSVAWSDVGGLADVKSEILDTIQLPLQYPELLASGLRRSGLLFYGPPGTGKTMMAKAIATECSLNFLSVKGPELINMYVGQSEQNVREVFERARSATPCVIFFDELDSLAPNRGKSGDSGGVMDRVVSQLLAELDGLNKSCDVFVIGATNRPDLLDPALLRPGRFDKMLYLGVPEDKPSQLKILQALTRKFKLSKDLSLDTIVDQCPNNLTGADFYALCSDAMLNAVKDRIKLLQAGETSDQGNLEVTEANFLKALSNLTPSVSEKELHRYRQIKDHLSGQQIHPTDASEIIQKLDFSKFDLH